MFHIKQRRLFEFYGINLERQVRYLAGSLLVNYYRCWNPRPQFWRTEPLKYWSLGYKSFCRLCVPSSLPISYLLNVTAITKPVISRTLMMQGMQPPAKGKRALKMWNCRMSRAYREANALRSCTLWVSVIMHWTDYEQGMFFVLKGGKTTLFPLISAIVPYLKHDIKPDCQSKPKQICRRAAKRGSAASSPAMSSLQHGRCQVGQCSLLCLAELEELAHSATVQQHWADILTFIPVSNLTVKQNKHFLLLAERLR